MIKLLHTADLHLGRAFHDRSLIEDQGFFLDQIKAILRDPSYRALIIAGDVYDRSIPSPEAVGLFGSFLGALKSQNPALEIMVIPGNHDSPARLGFGRELFAELGIHFAAACEDAFEPVILEAVSGPGAKAERCAFFLLPFLNPGCLCADGSLSADGCLDAEANPCAGGDNPGPGEALRSQAQLAAEAARRLEASRRRWAVPRAVLAAHLFAGGGAESESERIFLGGAEKVDMGLFAGFDYVALGHLHRCQKAGPNGWYSGSPLAYSFGEAGTGKVALSVTLPPPEGESPPGAAVRVEPIPIQARYRVSRLQGPFERFNHPSPQDKELEEAAGDYLEFSLSDSSLTENALPILQNRYPRLLSVKQETARRNLGTHYPGPAGISAPGERRDSAADFEEFLKGLYGQADPGKMSLFRELLAQAEAEERESPETPGPGGES